LRSGIIVGAQECRVLRQERQKMRAVCLQCEEFSNDIADQARMFRELCAIFMRDGGQFHSRHGDTRTFREITRFFYKYVDQEEAEQRITAQVCQLKAASLH